MKWGGQRGSGQCRAGCHGPGRQLGAAAGPRGWGGCKVWRHTPTQQAAAHSLTLGAAWDDVIVCAQSEAALRCRLLTRPLLLPKCSWCAARLPHPGASVVSEQGKCCIIKGALHRLLSMRHKRRPKPCRRAGCMGLHLVQRLRVVAALQLTSRAVKAGSDATSLAIRTSSAEALKACCLLPCRSPVCRSCASVIERQENDVNFIMKILCSIPCTPGRQLLGSRTRCVVLLRLGAR